MRTTKPFSTISFNSKKFLVQECDKMIQDGLICFYAFMPHLAEEDEKKDHIHLYMIPNGQVDTEKLRERLLEPSVNEDGTEAKALGCLIMKSSKFVDWYLYSLHDRDYLLLKLQERKYHYNKEDFVVSDQDEFIQLYHMSDFTPYKRMSKFRDMASSGCPFTELVSNGLVPVQQIFQYREMYNMMSSHLMAQEYNERVERAGRTSHTPNTDCEQVIISDEEL